MKDPLYGGKPLNEREREQRKLAQYAEAQSVLKSMDLWEFHKHNSYEQQVDIAFRALQRKVTYYESSMCSDCHNRLSAEVYVY